MSSTKYIKTGDIDFIISKSSIPKYNLSYTKMILSGLISALIFFPFIHAKVALHHNDSMVALFLYMMAAWAMFFAVEVLTTFVFNLIAEVFRNMGAITSLIIRTVLKTFLLSLAFQIFQKAIGFT